MHNLQNRTSQIIAIGLLLTLIIFMIAWEIGACGASAFNGNECRELGGAAYLYSSPSRISFRISSGDIDFAPIADKGIVTFSRSLFALILTSIGAISWVVFATRSKWIKLLGFGLVLLLQVIPFVSFIWLVDELLGTYAKVAFGVVVAIFPLFGALYLALDRVPRSHLELFDLASASFSDRLKHLYYPFLIPAFFSGLTLAAPLAVVGVIIADLAGGDDTGLGSGMLMFSRQSDPGVLWIYTMVAIVISCLLWGGVAILRLLFRKFSPWYDGSV